MNGYINKLYKLHKPLSKTNDNEVKKFNGFENYNPLSGFYGELRIASARNRRQIFLNEDIQENSIFEVMYHLERIEHLDKLEGTKKPIEIIITSGGGSVFDGYGLISKIEYLKDNGYEIIMTVPSYACSMAFDLLIVGSKRRAGRYAKFMLHTGYTRLGGDLQTIEEQYEEYNKEWQIAVDLYTKYTKLTVEEIDAIKRGKKDKWFTAKEALENGVIDEIF